MSYKNILIVKLSAIGDVVHALPVAYALKQAYPQAKISWIVEKAAYELLTNNPNIDEVIIFEKQKYKSLAGFMANGPAFIGWLRQQKYDLVLDLQGLFKSGMIAFCSGAKTRLVYENTREGSQWLSTRIVGAFAKEHVVDRYLDVVRALGCSVRDPIFTLQHTVKEKELTAKIAAQAGFNIDSTYAVLILGANWPNKIWPFTHYAALCKQLWDDKMIPVLIGTKGEEKLAREIERVAEILPVNLTGKTSLKQLSYIMKKARIVIGGDTGPLHLAAAVGTPVVALMGPTDTRRNGPYGKGHSFIVTPRDCAGCWQRRCPKKLDCLAAISPKEVYEHIHKVLYKGEPDANRIHGD